MFIGDPVGGEGLLDIGGVGDQVDVPGGFSEGDDRRKKLPSVNRLLARDLASNAPQDGSIRPHHNHAKGNPYTQLVDRCT